MKNKRKIPLPSVVRVVGILIIALSLFNINKKEEKHIKVQAKEFYKKTEKIRQIPTVEVEEKNAQKEENIVQKLEIEVAEAEYEPPVEEVNEEPVQEENIEENTSYEEITSTGASYTTRMTSYYPEEGESITGSGLGPNDFGVNEFGWFTYNGKLVVAAATEYLLKYGFSLAEGVHTYRYFDEITLNIDGVDYPAIVLDSCGSSMQTDRIDLFVSGSWAVKDTQIIVKQ